MAAPEDANVEVTDGAAIAQEATDELAVAMAAALDKAHRLRCNGVPLIIKQNDPDWLHVVTASRQARDAGVSPDDWIAAIIAALRGFSKSANPFPHASQLHGAKAATYVGNFIAATGPGAKGARRARLNVGVPLSGDHEYQGIRLRMKKNIHDMEDVAYMRTRQIEIYGAEKPWLKDFENSANARTAPLKAASPDQRARMNGKHPAGVS